MHLSELVGSCPLVYVAVYYLLGVQNVNEWTYFRYFIREQAYFEIVMYIYQVSVLHAFRWLVMSVQPPCQLGTHECIDFSSGY